MANNITPELTAESAPYGILSPASVVVETSGGAWESKIEYTDYTCNTETTLEGICIPGLTESVTAVGGSGDGGFLHEYYPFSIETSFMCSPMGMSLGEIKKRAEDALIACRQKAIEAEFSSGLLGKKMNEADNTILNPYLSDGTASDVTPTGGAVSPRVGIAILEQAIANCGCGTRGTIHGQPMALSNLRLNIPKDSTDPITTKLGNYVISGSGYAGQSPTGDDTSGTETYMYATGRVLVVLGDINVYPNDSRKRYEAVDTSNNTVRYTVSQTAAVLTGGCCKSAVLVDITK